jgi:carbon storage regulator
MLVLSRKLGEKIVINNNITVTVCELEGNKVRLGIDAPPSVRILRSELTDYQAEQRTARKDASDADLAAKPQDWQDVAPNVVITR